MSRSPIHHQQKMLEKKAKQASKSDPAKSKEPQPKPVPKVDTQGTGSLPIVNKPGKAMLGSLGTFIYLLNICNN